MKVTEMLWNWDTNGKVTILYFVNFYIILIYKLNSDGPAYNFYNTGLKGNYLSTPHCKVTLSRTTLPKVICSVSARIDCAATTPEKTTSVDKKVVPQNVIIPPNVETYHKNKNDGPQKYEKNEVNHHRIDNHTDKTEIHKRITVWTGKEYNITHIIINKEHNIPGVHENSQHKTNKNNTQNTFIHTTVQFFFSQNHPT